MGFSTFSDYSKKFAHWAIDNTFPCTDTIALISAGAGWYAPRFILTYFPGAAADQNIKVVSSFSVCRLLPNWACWGVGFVTAPLWVPDATPRVSHWASVGASCATSLALNLVAKYIFKIKPTRFEEKPVSFAQNVQRDKLLKATENLKATKEIIQDSTKKCANVAIHEKRKNQNNLIDQSIEEDDIDEDEDDFMEEEIDDFPNKKVLLSENKSHFTDDEPDDRLFSLECFTNLCT